MFLLKSAALYDILREEWGGLGCSLSIWMGRCKIAPRKAEQDPPSLPHLGPSCLRGVCRSPHLLCVLSVWFSLTSGEEGEGRVRHTVPGEG